MTLRELYMWLNPEYAQKWREEQMKRLRPANPSYMDGGSLRDVFQQKHNQINSVLDQQRKQYGEPSIEEMFNYDRRYKGML